jgi:hypothetical protein
LTKVHKNKSKKTLCKFTLERFMMKSSSKKSTIVDNRNGGKAGRIKYSVVFV